MALEPGGYADKLGNRYEGRWVVKQLLRLLDERLTSVRLEAIGEDQYGVDLWIETAEGIKQAHQCKARNAGSEKWTVAALHARGILDAMRGHLDRDANCEFAMVSAVEGKLIHDICESARNSNGDPEAFLAHQIDAISEARSRTFRDFCGYLNLQLDQESDRARAFDYLRRMHIIHWEDDLESRNSLRDQARMLVVGDPKLVIPALADFAEDSLRKTITAGDVRGFLVSLGMHPRQLPHDDRVWPNVQALQDLFKQSISPRLIGNQLISRTETVKVLEALREKGLVVVHGGAGSGKSGVLYELVTKLEEQGHPYLPIRLDRQVPEHTPLLYGESLGLPESPARCLEAISDTDLSVLIIDQLDAIRWTARHSLNALDVCKAIVTEINSLRSMGVHVAVVLACRTFDLEHDPEIKAWLHGGAEQQLVKIEVKELSEEDVKRVCERVGQKCDSLSTRQLTLLRVPNHLAMWVQIVASGQIPDFRTGPQLMRQFWDNRRLEVEKAGIGATDIDDVLDALIDNMEQNNSISAPLSLVEKRPLAFQALQSQGVLTSTGRRVSFAHQSYVDYQIASRLMAQVQSGRGSVRKWLGDKSEQSLFRREQLRQVLSLLEEESHTVWVATIREILEDSNVRFHVKHLVLELVSQIDEPQEVLLKYLGELIARDEWREHVLETVCVRHAPYVRWLLHNGVLARWLNADTDKDRNAALWLLRSVADDIPDEVAEVVKPYAEYDDEWRQRVLACLCWNEVDDSDVMFELRLNLARRRIFKGWVDWKGLAGRQPVRAIRLISALASTWTAQEVQSDEFGGGQRQEGRSRVERWTDDDLRALKKIASEQPVCTWDELMPHIERLTTLTDESRRSFDAWQDGEHWREPGGYVNTGRGMVELVTEAGRILAGRDPESLLARTRSLHVSTSRVTQLVIMEAYAALPGEYADEALLWLLADSSRLSLGSGRGEPEWAPAARLILALSPHCSEKVFKELEESVVHYHAPTERDMAEYYLKSWREGWYGDYWGRAQHFLLPALCPQRRNTHTTGLIGVLKQKFHNYAEWRFLRSGHSTGGWVGSPISPERLLKLSDKTWLRTVCNEGIPPYQGSHRQMGVDRVAESSVRHFSRDLSEMAKRFPDRFGRLALRFPQNAHPDYVAAILEGLKQTEPPNIPEPEKAAWRPGDSKLVEDVLAKLNLSDDCGVARAFCWLIHSRAEEQWSEPVIARLVHYATDHSDPELGQLNFWSSDKGRDVSHATCQELVQNTLNCVRGVAALAVGQLLWHHRDWLPRFEACIGRLVSDSHPVVRTAAIEACLPVLNIDRDRAISWFCAASKDDLRVAGSRAGVYFFNTGIESHHDKLARIISQMLTSPYEDVVQEGAEEVTARWLFHGMFEDELRTCQKGTVPQRKGIAQVASHFLVDEKYAVRCQQLLLPILNDSESAVRKETQRAFFDKRILSVPNAVEFVQKHIESQAYADDPSSLMHAIEDYEGSLIPYSQVILSICAVLSTTLREESRNPATGVAADAAMVPPILLRLYDQARDQADSSTLNRCLDAWDMLFENRVGMTRDITRSIER